MTESLKSPLSPGAETGGDNAATSSVAQANRVVLDFDDNLLLSRLVGAHDRNLALLEDRFRVAITSRGNRMVVEGPSAAQTGQVLRELYGRLQRGLDVTEGDIEGAVKFARAGVPSVAEDGKKGQALRTRKRVIVPRSPTQSAYVAAMQSRELVIGTGPAGTGKTYLAVACAAAQLLEGRVERIILSRPAVEAGESIGFLPGDMREKIDPYLRPLYDALHDMLPGDQVMRYLANGEIEVAPLGFMRGRTLSNAFIILDEAQNTTPMQMKMFLTRLGENSRMVVVGDPSQVDLPLGARSGLSDALETLKNISEVSFIRFTDADVMRHHLVTKIVQAYDEQDTRGRLGKMGGRKSKADDGDKAK